MAFPDLPPLRDIRAMLRAVGPILRRAVASGQVFRPACELTEPTPDISAEYDVKIPLRDGTFVTANIFRSRRAAADNERVPVIMSAHPYDNSLLPALGRTPLGGPPQQYRMIAQEGRPRFSTQTSWEAPDPNYWVPAGYAVVNMNMPGYASSGGIATLFSPEQADAYAQAIDWIGERDWCTGRVGLSGVSYLAISQYMVASGETEHGVPRALAAISPWEGISNLFQDMFYEGGLEEVGFPVFWWYTEVKPVINATEDELIAREGGLPHEIGKVHPTYSDYWKRRVPDLAKIDVPMLVCASFSDQGLHTRGSFRVFSNARSNKKWLYTHRRLKWDAYYSDDALAAMRAFFDYFVKGEKSNGFAGTDRVRLEVRRSRDEVHEVRAESEWPLARTDYRKLFLTADRQLREEPPYREREIAYDAMSGEVRALYEFTEPTEITGYMKLRLHVEARAGAALKAPPDDMAIFIAVLKRDRHGARVPFYGPVGNHADAVARGLLRVSRRRLDEAASTEWEPVLRNDRPEPLAPGEIAPVEIAINPSSTFFDTGEMIELVISPNAVIDTSPFVKNNSFNRGTHVIHLGGDYDSHLLVPVIPHTAQERVATDRPEGQA